jgi:TorA maturation chaperone TorD
MDGLVNEAVLDKPSAEQHRWLSSEAFEVTLRELCDRFGVDVPSGGLVDWSGDEHESTYLACFEVGLPTPKVVLQASHYNRRAPAPRVIHEHQRLYRLFDAKLAARNLDQQDHLLNQVAFLMHLDELVMGGAVDLPAVVHARRDFIEKHVRDHVRSALQSARAPGVPAVYATALALLDAALAQDVALSNAWLRLQAVASTAGGVG